MDNKEDEIWTPAECAAFLKIRKVDTIYGLIQSGELPAIKVGKQYRLLKSVVLQSRSVKSRSGRAKE